MAVRLRCTLLALALCAALLPHAVEAQALRGSRTSVERIYGQAKSQGLTFHKSSASVRTATARGELVQLKPTANLTLHGVSYPYVLPATHTFVTRLSAQYRSACGERLVVTSATRPTYIRLANSVDKSVHPTGMAIDLRRPARASCQRWLRSTLIALNGTGTVETVEERNPPHFHVAVFPRQYLAYVGGRAVSPTPSSSVASRAAAISTYRVRKGDSLWTIARRHDTTVERLRRANNLRGSRLLPGQVLRIPR
ncbi:MAG: LysM peptidoglycan-binding domain-containing protein [Gemmatimonadota bacterium]|jgi:LysM repeat protein|nr:LysM peptidoglycan-binding domain-containing protein [Gemmatimonadota bacterium]